MFSRHGIPDLLHSDNGPQFSSEELNQFAKSYDFELSTSSPYYPQGNGLVERMVKTIKSLFNKSEDRYLSLLIYRSTPLLWCGLSPFSLLMGRQPRSTLPQINSHLTPDWSHLISFPENDMNFKEKQKQNYDSRHRVHFQNTPYPKEQPFGLSQTSVLLRVLFTLMRQPLARIGLILPLGNFTKLDFHRFQVHHFSNNFEQSPCYYKMGQCQRASLSVFGRIKFITRRNISV